MKQSDRHEDEIEMLEQMIKFSGQKMLEEQGDRLDAEDDALELPQELQDSIMKMIEAKRAEEQKQKKRLARQELRRKVVRKMAASIALVAAIGLVGGSLIMHVDAWRIPLLNFVLNSQDGKTEMKFENPDSDDPVSIPAEMICPTYLPEGFFIIDSNSDDMKNSITYGNEEGEIVLYTVYRSDRTILTLYTDEEKSPADICGYDGFIIRFKNAISIIWGTEDNVFEIYGNIEEGEAIKMAESIIL